MTLHTTLRFVALSCLMASFVLATGQQAVAQPGSAPAASDSSGSEYYYPSPVTEHQETRSIAQQKAMQRAENRMQRLEVHRRYGVTPNRPSAVGVPFTSVSTITWTRPRAGLFVYNSGYYRPYYYSAPYAYPHVVRR